MESGKMLKQWISSTKDSVFISEELLYYGKFLSGKNAENLNPEDLNKLGSIPLSYLKSFQIDRKKKTTTLEYGNRSEYTILIRWENLESIDDFKNFMLKQFPDSYIVPVEDKIKSKTRGPIAALIVIPIIYIIALGTGTDKTYHAGSRVSGEAIVALFQALSSLGVLVLTGLFGSLFLIALLKLFYTRNKSHHITIVQLR